MTPGVLCVLCVLCVCVAGTLSQFYVSLPSKDKFLVLYVLVRLELISGKAIFFVNSVDMYGGRYESYP